MGSLTNDPLPRIDRKDINPVRSSHNILEKLSEISMQPPHTL